MEIPFGKAAIWAASIEEVKACAKGNCEDETKLPVLQALKYALNNAKIALKHASSENLLKDAFEVIDELTGSIGKLENADPGSKSGH